MTEHIFKDYRKLISSKYSIWANTIPSDRGFHKIYNEIIEMLDSLCQKYHDPETIPEYLGICVGTYMCSIIDQLDTKIQAYMAMNVFSEELIVSNAKNSHNLIKGESEK